MKYFLNTLFIFICLTSFSQSKKIIDHNAYDEWRKIKTITISNDGNYVAYQTNPYKGDGYLYLYNNTTNQLDSFPRGTHPEFSKNDYLVFTIVPEYDSIRQMELDKVDKKKWPKDTLGIYLLVADSLMKIDNVASFSLTEEGDWMTYTKHSNDPASAPEKSKKRKKKKKKGEAVDSYESDGKLTYLFNPITKVELKFNDIVSTQLSKTGQFAALQSHQNKNEIESYQLITINLTSLTTVKDTNKFTVLENYLFNEQETKSAFIASKDTGDVQLNSLYLFDLKSTSFSLIVDTLTTSIPQEKSISVNRDLQFTEDGSALYFGIADRPLEEEKDTLLESEKVKLDLWHYKNNRLQPQQLHELKREKRKTHTYVYHIKNQSIAQISNDSLQVYLPNKIVNDYVIGFNIEPYQYKYNWSMPWPEDQYLVNLKTGENKLLKKEVGYGGPISPAGKFYCYFDEKSEEIQMVEIATGNEVCITCSEKEVNWQEDVNGMPYTPEPLGVIGWERGEDKVWIASEYDVYVYSFSQNKLSCLTNHMGEQSKLRMRIREWERDSIYLSYSNVYISAFDENTKGRNLMAFKAAGKTTTIIPLVTVPEEIVYVKKAKNSDHVLIRKMSTIQYPEITLYTDNFTKQKVISNTNPQQSAYNWATVELVKWTSYDSVPLQGLLYKPENYDPNKTYPLLVYFYEMYSDELNNHYVPKPTASIIYPTEYASAGYLVFIPDIRYKEGYPARGAYDCIMSGTDYILSQYKNVDSTRMGLQGQSWGGYQTAQLITMTTRYKAAMAGAPVSNMFSAYGGIRWGSGLNRQFQYEKTQSRIGQTIWDAPELYVENSPIFHIPKIQTPLLIMSNDGDGAVPWYQGIEMFTGMKRLNKPVWLLNYNGDAHNLMIEANRLDLSIRMRQFFDYYLMEQPAPSWLIDGIPAIDKGKKLGYELKE